MNNKTEHDLTTDKILKLWKQNKSIDWRQLNTIKEKREWLKACLEWTGLPKAAIASHNYCIDANQIVEEVDFYCLLGEVFFGYRGYFGQDLHGFNDCFSEIYIYEEKGPVVSPGATVTINDHDDLAKVLNRDFEDYFSDFIKSLKKNGFTVNLR